MGKCQNKVTMLPALNLNKFGTLPDRIEPDRQIEKYGGVERSA